MKGELPCLPLIQERFYNIIKNIKSCRDIEHPNFEMRMFPQMWSSTALGFGGIGGQAITTAYTTVISEQNLNIWGVFFGERIAYIIDEPNKLFFEDLKNSYMTECNHSHQYKKGE